MLQRFILALILLSCTLRLQTSAWVFPNFDNTKYPGQIVNVFEAVLTGKQLVPPLNDSLTAGYARITTYVYTPTYETTVDFAIYLQSFKDSGKGIVASIANAPPGEVGDDVLTVPGKFKLNSGNAQLKTRVKNATYAPTDVDPDLSVTFILSTIDITPREFYIRVVTTAHPDGLVRGILRRTKNLL